MRRYNQYKDSGVEWIGEIPSHWEETRLRFVGDLFGGLTGKSGDDFKQDNNPNNKPYIPYTNIFRNTYISKEHFDYVVIESGENQNKVKKYDLFFLMSSETYQDLGKPCILIDDVDELYLNSFCKGFRIKKECVYPLFLNYQLLGDVHKELISIEGRGFTRINLRQDRLNDTRILLPPLSEQEEIVSYLDTKTSLIDTLIENTQKKIELLKEKRTSLISEVVTKGLNPNVEMKDSGVEWIGEIPKGWEELPLRFYFSYTKGSNGQKLTKTYIEDNKGDFPVYSGQTENNGILGYVNEYEFDYEFPLVFTTTVGAKFMSIKLLEGKLSLSQNCLVMIKKKECLPSYFQYLLSFDFQYRRELIPIIIQPSLRMEDLDRMTIIVPPLSEQEEIVSYLDEQTQLIDKTISVEQRRIELLKEYRQSLISEVVTGKRKVTNDE
jgi:type I restriction enzyme S subunit